MHREPFGESFPLVAADRYQAWAVTSGCGGSVRRGRREVGPVAIAGLLIGVAFPLSLRPAVAVTTRATIQGKNCPTQFVVISYTLGTRRGLGLGQESPGCRQR